MQVSVIYAGDSTHAWIKLNVADNTTVNEAIEQSGILKQYPDIDLRTMKVGVFGRFTKPDSVLSEGDRVEIYRPILRVLDEDDDEDDED